MEENNRVVIISSDGQSPLAPVLESLGYLPATVDSSGIEIYQDRNLLPGLFIVSYAADDGGWLNAVRRIREQDAAADVPVLMLIDESEKEKRASALEAGVNDFIVRPFDKVEFRARVAALFRADISGKRITAYEKDIEAEVNRRLRELTLAFEKVKIASLDTVYRLSRAAEYRDDDVGAHIERMSHYATAIARAMKLQERYIENILWAAPMHDVGKIGIPDSILRKPGKLDDEEWKIMKGHTTIGSEILRDSTTDFIKMAGEIALTHHEKWDGSGYPKALKGEDIPLAGRIVAIADVFDALTSERPYKKPFTLEKAFSLIDDGIGSHFDPKVASAFLSVRDEIIKEYNFWKFMSLETDSSDSEADLSGLFG